jgi:hypothetical protein
MMDRRAQGILCQLDMIEDEAAVYFKTLPEMEELAKRLRAVATVIKKQVAMWRELEKQCSNGDVA